jgi:uncharacterized protein (DUF111 family)
VPNVVRALAGRRTNLAGLRDGADDAGGGALGDGGNSGDGASGATPPTGDDGGDPDASAESSNESPPFILEGCVLLETNIDHLSPEALAFACEELLAAGALDVWQESITMKKGRLAVRLCALASAGAAKELAERVVALTGSLGVRGSTVERLCVPRAVVTENTRYGAVAFKTALVATPSGRVRLRRPEYEDVARVARQQGLDFNALYEELGGTPCCS